MECLAVRRVRARSAKAICDVVEQGGSRGGLPPGQGFGPFVQNFKNAEHSGDQGLDSASASLLKALLIERNPQAITAANQRVEADCKRLGIWRA